MESTKKNRKWNNKRVGGQEEEVQEEEAEMKEKEEEDEEREIVRKRKKMKTRQISPVKHIRRGGRVSWQGEQRRRVVADKSDSLLEEMKAGSVH